jgi:hypothetical protein
MKQRDSMFLKRVEIYRSSSCIEEYCVKRDLQMPSFRWKLLDSIVFCVKHRALIQAVWNDETSLLFVVVGSLAGGIWTAVCKYVFGCDGLMFVFIISMASFSFLTMALFFKIYDVCFELGILQIRKK